jgi:hypothetical protein
MRGTYDTSLEQEYAKADSRYMVVTYANHAPQWHDSRLPYPKLDTYAQALAYIFDLQMTEGTEVKIHYRNIDGKFAWHGGFIDSEGAFVLETHSSDEWLCIE